MSFVLFSLLSLGAQAATPVAAPPPAAVPEKKQCRRYETTGSIMGAKMVCHTKSEWASIDNANGAAASSLSDPRGHFGGLGARLGD